MVLYMLYYEQYRVCHVCTST